MRSGLLLTIAACLLLSGCGGPSEPELWIYTSIYRDVLDRMAPELERAIPEVRMRWYKAGSEEVAARLTAELAAGVTPADVLVTADPFWYQALSEEGLLRPCSPASARDLPGRLRGPDDTYLSSRAAVMVVGFNRAALGGLTPPRTFAELADARWKGRVVIGDPLKSGTALATVCALESRLGWDYYRALRLNDVVVEGGNSAVLRRIETGDRPVGVLLLENLLKAREHGSSTEILFPQDGAVVIPSPIAVLASTDQPAAAEKLVSYIMGPEGQAAMVRGYMYAIDERIAGPRGAPPFGELLKSGFVLDAAFVRKTTPRREEIKETFGQVMFE